MWIGSSEKFGCVSEVKEPWYFLINLSKISGEMAEFGRSTGLNRCEILIRYLFPWDCHQLQKSD